MSTSIQLRPLLVEDRANDAKLIMMELERAGYELENARVVDSERAFIEHLSPSLDVILCDGHLPQFHVSRALELMRERGVDVPLLVVTGTLTDEEAVELLQMGVEDYLLKDRLARLRPAIDQVLLRRRALAESKRSREERQQFFLASHDLLCVVGADGHFKTVNPAWMRTLGWDESQLLGRPYLEFVHAEDREATRRAHEQMFRGEPLAGELENRYVARDGSVHWLRWGASAVQSDGRAFAAARDVTDRKLAEEEIRQSEERLRQSQKMEAFGQLAGGVAHDFNNLLTVICGYVGMALEEVRPEDPLYECIDAIQRSAKRATSLTRQLLAFSRKQVLQPKVLDLNGVVSDSGSMLRRLIGEDVELKMELEQGLAPVRVDPGQLDQVILNLVVNARDAMPRGGRIAVATRAAVLDGEDPPTVPAGRYVALTVTDAGIGIPPENLSKIFEPFFTTKELGKGTGLGLATVFGIVQQSGGHIHVKSEVGRGTRFDIYLPPARHEPEERAARAAAVPARVNTETILLVEDEAEVRTFARLSLTRAGWNVLEAGSPAEALTLCERHAGTIQMVVTDVVMPGISGAQLLTELRARRAQLKVLFVSGYTADSMLRHGIEESRVPFLAKPFTGPQLARRVREVLDAPFTEA